MPSLGWGEFHLETKAAVGIDGFRCAIARADCDRAVEIGILVGRAQTLFRVRPFRGDATAANDVA